MILRTRLGSMLIFRKKCTDTCIDYFLYFYSCIEDSVTAIKYVLYLNLQHIFDNYECYTRLENNTIYGNLIVCVGQIYIYVFTVQK